MPPTQVKMKTILNRTPVKKREGKQANKGTYKEESEILNVDRSMQNETQTKFTKMMVLNDK